VGDVLQLQAFRRLAASYALNELTWSFGTVALAVVVYARTGDVLATAALFLVTSLVPGLVAPVLVSRLDAWRPGRVLGVMYAVEAGVFGVLAVAIDGLPLAGILALAFADGAIAVSGRALTRAAVATELEPRGLLRQGNALLNVLFSTCLALGPLAAGGLQALTSSQVALAVAAGLFAAAGLAVARLQTRPARPDGTGDRARVRETLRVLAAAPAARAALLVHGVAFLTACAVTPVEVALAEDVLGGGPDTYGLLLAAWGAGSVVGSGVFVRLDAMPALRIVPAAYAVMALGLLVVSATTWLGVVLVGCLVGGLANGLGYVAVVQALQDHTPSDLRARSQSVLESVNALATGSGYLLGGAVGALTGPREVFLLAGISVLVTVGLLGRRAILAGQAVAAERA
jgi:hypothetical protein